MNAFRPDPGWLGFHPGPSKPAYKLPPGAVDAHCHVFGPGSVFPYAPSRAYTPSDAPKERLWALRDFLGFERSVIVQGTCHGTDNRALTDALRTAGERARGVATVTGEVTDAELTQLHADGVRGVRFTFVRRLGEVAALDVVADVARRIAPLGWHVVVYFEAPDLPRLRTFLAELPVVAVVDHMGRPDVTQRMGEGPFAEFLAFMRAHPHIWSKVSGAERLSVIGPPNYPDFVPFARHVVENFPDRVLWGTDWPHPNMRSHVPDDGALVDLLPQIAPTPQLQRALLVDNPMRLYWSR
jgi:2-pyrone-4,6-dicarboxylate lactonase